MIKTLSPEIVEDKVILIRLDLNVPLKDGVVQEDTRIIESLPTLHYLLKNNAKRVHILTHLGRPKGEVVPALSAQCLVEILSQKLGEDVEFRDDYSAGNARMQLHENTRFRPEEKKGDQESFAQEILDGTGAEIFINDGFAVSHRAQTSVIGFAGKIPCYAGFLLQKEIEALAPFLTDEKIPGLVLVAGGAKMETKVPVLKHFAKIADHILVGGALSNTFQVAQGHDVGESMYEEDFVETAREVLEIANTFKTGFHSPIDVICADDIKSENTADLPLEDVCGDAKIFDIGPHSIASFSEILQHANVIIWNGPLGVIEKKNFAKGTQAIAGVIGSQTDKRTILGGGDTIEALRLFGLDKSRFTHVSTGGGAMLEFLAGNQLPGIEILA